MIMPTDDSRQHKSGKLMVTLVTGESFSLACSQGCGPLDSIKQNDTIINSYR